MLQWGINENDHGIENNEEGEKRIVKTVLMGCAGDREGAFGVFKKMI